MRSIVVAVLVFGCGEDTSTIDVVPCDPSIYMQLFGLVPSGCQRACEFYEHDTIGLQCMGYITGYRGEGTNGRHCDHVMEIDDGVFGCCVPTSTGSGTEFAFAKCFDPPHL